MAYNPVETFFQEAEELVADIEQSALGLCAEEQPVETVNRLFRAFHTIKGSGDMCGLDAVAAFTHHVESLLDRVRSGETPASAPLAELVLQATDHIRALLNAAQGGAAVSSGSGEKLIAVIAEFANPGAASVTTGGVPPPPLIAENTGGAERTWSIRFHPNAAFLANGGNPAALLKDLRRLGSCDVTAHTDEVPDLDRIQADRCYLWWTIGLRAACDENAIHDVFIFVEDDSRLEIREAESAAASVEQSTGAEQVNKAIQQLDQVIQQNAAASEEMAATSKELANQAEVLQSAIAFFKVDDGHQSQAPQMRRAKAHVPLQRRSSTGKADLHSTAASLAYMSRAVKSGGPSIELSLHDGGADSRDKDFTPSQA